MKHVLTCLSALALLPHLGRAQAIEAKLLSPDQQPNWFFGAAVAISGDVLLVAQAGQVFLGGEDVFVFQRGATGWEFDQRISHPDDSGALDNFGESVAIDGDVAVVSAATMDVGGLFDTGALYVFERGIHGWELLQRLESSDAQAGDFLGLTGLEIEEGTIVASAFGPDPGSVCVFERSGDQWNQTARLFSGEAGPGHTFGRSLDLRGDRLVVGEDRIDEHRGAVSIFKRSRAGGWRETHRVRAPDGEPDDLFGSGVSLSGSSLAVGAVGADGEAADAGAIYLFGEVGEEWVFTQRFVAPDGQAGDALGREVHLRGDTLLLGASEFGSQARTGGVFLLRQEHIGWRLVAKLQAADGEAGDIFGAYSDYDGQHAVISALWDQDFGAFSGAAYVLDLPLQAKPYGSCSTLAPCDNAALFGGCSNSTGEGATLAAASPSGEGAWTIAACNLPRKSSAVLFGAPRALRVPFGDGLLWVDPRSGLWRGIDQLSDSQGTANWPLDLTRGPWLSGETWFFQALYSDPLGPCGSGFSTTGGLELSIEP